MKSLRRLKPLVGVSVAYAIFHIASTSIPPVSAFLGGIAEPRFKFEGLIDVGSLGLQDVDGLIAAVGDVDGHQLLSLFVLSPDQRTVRLFEWDRAAYTFKAAPDARPVTAPFVVTNVVPGDFDYDGRLDMLLMGQDSPAGWFSDDELKMVMHRGIGRGNFHPAVSVPSSHLQQPMLLDADGNMQVDMLGYPFSKDSKQQELKLWRNAWQQSNGSELFTVDAPPILMDGFDCKSPNPHSNAFVDLDGDCLADLFLVCQDPADDRKLSYRILTNSKSAGFQLAQTGQLPEGAGQVSFADMDRDGTLDMVFPTCNSDGCHINIAYNQQMPLCTTTGGLTSRTFKTSDQRCRDSGSLCTADPQFSFDLSADASNGGYQRIPLKTLLPDTPYLVLSDSSFNGKLPNPIRIGDFNKDGYPDLLVVASSRSSPQQGQVALLESLSCTPAACGDAASKASRRTFTKVDGSTAQALNVINDAKSAFWLDIDEDGTLDIVIQRAGRSSGASRKITFIKNNFYHDAFFLKTLFANGACNGVCIGSNGTQYNPYGVSYSGASYKFTVLDTTGTRRATQVGQLPQTGYMSLQTPYSYFGLGRTNNYVENLFVGSTRHQSQHFTSIEGLIPNSHVVIVPYQPEDVQRPDSWDRQLFLQPGKWIPWVGVALFVALFCLATTVLVLHINEKRQDEIERRKAQHLINFDAL